MSWRKTGGTRFHFAMESCPQNEHSKLERQDSLSEWNLVHKNSTETGATRSFFMESCPQKEHRHWSDKILFRHVLLSTERTQTLERKDSLSSCSLVHRKNTDTGATRFSFVM